MTASNCTNEARGCSRQNGRSLDWIDSSARSNAGKAKKFSSFSFNFSVSSFFSAIVSSYFQSSVSPISRVSELEICFLREK